MENNTNENSKKLSITERELEFKNHENEKLVAQLALVNQELVFQTEEKEKLAAELLLANLEITFHNGEKQKREAELIAANLQLVFKNKENTQCAASLKIVNKQLVKTEEQLNQLNAELKQHVDGTSKEVSKLENRFRALIENSADMKTIATPEGKIIFGSPSITKVLGYSVDEFIATPGSELIHPDDIAGFIEKMQGILQTPGAAFQSRHRLLHKNGNWIWCEGTVTNMLHQGSIQGLVSNFRDITQKKKAEDEMIKANRMYAFISAINQSIVHIDDEDELLNIACTIAIEIGKFKIAWIGLLDENGKLNPTKLYGNETALREVENHLIFDYQNEPLCHTPTGKAIITGKYALCNDVQNDTAMLPWKDLFVKDDIKSILTFPLIKFGKTAGVFSFHSTHENYFNTQEISLLQETTGDISFALENFETKALHKKANERLKESETKLKKAQAVAHFGHWELDLNSGIALWSDEACKIYGIDPLDNMQSHEDWKKFVHPDDMGYVLNMIDEQRKTLSPVSFEHRIIRKDGSIRYIHSESEFIFNTKREAVTLYGINQDITEQKIAEAERKKIERLNQSLIENINDAIILLNKNSEVVYQSPSTERISGFSFEEVKGKAAFEFIHPDDLENCLAFISQSYLSPKIPLHNQYRILHKQGHYIWIEGTITNLFSDEHINGFIVNYRDITERKIAEHELRKLSLAIDQSPASVLITDTNGNIEYVNKKFEEVSGYKAQEVMGKTPRILKSGYTSPEEYKILWQQIKSGQEWRGEFQNIKKNGEIYWESALIAPINNVKGEITNFLAVKEDITEWKKAENKLKLSEAFNRGVLSSLSSHIAVIDHAGEIVAVNEAWNRFSLQNGETSLHRTGEGSNYFNVCEKSLKEGDEIAGDALEGMKAVMEGKTNGFYLEYPCHSPTKKRWFGMRVMKFESDKNMIVVAHENITKIKKAEQERDVTLLELEERVEARTKDLADKNKDITDSINYAKRIQLGLLPRPSQLTEIFSKSFIFSEPQNIVSGDFFWCHQLRNKKFIVVADCTGHGVPGALMSIIGNNLLNQIVIDEHIENPSEILELLDERLTAAVKGDTQEVKDGMDIALCMIDTAFNELYFAGAYQPIFIADVKGHISELSASRYSIGAGAIEVNKRFETKRFSITSGQRVYLSSDGYYSQFGGTKDKKLMKSGFRKLLERIQPNPIYEHSQLLQAAFKEWSGKSDQVDDVLVVGIEL